MSVFFKIRLSGSLKPLKSEQSRDTAAPPKPKYAGVVVGSSLRRSTAVIRRTGKMKKPERRPLPIDMNMMMPTDTYAAMSVYI